MRVKLLPIDEEQVIRKLYTACRTCYSAGSPITNYEKEFTADAHSKADMLKLIKYVMSSGHTSILEVQNLTFLIEGVDRALTHQLVRHRAGVVFQQQSQRYVEFKDGKFDYVIPQSIMQNEELKSDFESTMLFLGTMYKKFTDAGIQAEDARAVLPNACCSNIVMTVNLRQLGHMCNERLCSTAQFPIRMLFKEITRQTVDVLPFMKEFLVPKCEMLGYCNEPRRTCGRKKLKDEVLK